MSTLNDVTIPIDCPICEIKGLIGKRILDRVKFSSAAVGSGEIVL